MIAVAEDVFENEVARVEVTMVRAVAERGGPAGKREKEGQGDEAFIY